MKFSSLLFASVFVLINVFAVSDVALAQQTLMPTTTSIPSPAFSGPIVITLGVDEIFISLIIFLIAPISFIGMILRLFGYKKVGEGKGWLWNIKQAVSRFLKYLLYHISLFGVWFLIVFKVLQERIYLPIGRYEEIPSAIEITQLIINDYVIIFLVYVFIFAYTGHYMVYFWRNIRGNSTLKPTLGLHIGLALWNSSIFFIAGIVLEAIISDRAIFI